MSGPDRVGPERRHSHSGRRKYDLPPWATVTLAFIAAIQPIVLAIVVALTK